MRNLYKLGVMNNTILVKIIIPSHVIAQIDTDMVNIPGTKGAFGVLPGHVKLISNMTIGIVSVFVRNIERKYFVYGGIVQVTGTELNIVTDFVGDLSKINKSVEINNITQLKLDLKNEEEGSLEASVIIDKIRKYETFLKFID